WDCGELFPHIIIHHPAPDGRAVQAATVRAHRRITINEEIVLHAMVATAADEHCPMNFVKDVAVNFGAAYAIVHVNTHRAHADAAGFVNVIVANSVSTEGVIASHVDGADVAG